MSDVNLCPKVIRQNIIHDIDSNLLSSQFDLDIQL
jgi:hypothetical protein